MATSMINPEDVKKAIHKLRATKSPFPDEYVGICPVCNKISKFRRHGQNNEINCLCIEPYL